MLPATPNNASINYQNRPSNNYYHTGQMLTYCIYSARGISLLVYSVCIKILFFPMFLDFEPAQSSMKFSDIGGCEETVEQVCKLLVHMRHPEVFRTLGVTPPRGFLLHGPPGCGKTLLAHAIAGVCIYLLHFCQKLNIYVFVHITQSSLTFDV